LSYSTVVFVCGLLFTLSTQAQTLTVAGGKTIRAATKHDVVRLEGNFDWKPEVWSNDNWNLSLNHAVSLIYFTDVNDVWAASWAPNFILTPADRSGFYPYLQFGIGVALFSEEELESEDSEPTDDGTTNLGSHGQFESSLALGLVRDRFSIRVKVYHFSNANLAGRNDGIDTAEVGISYRF